MKGKIILQLSIFFFLANVSKAQWILSNGNPDAYTWSIARNDSNVMAGVINGVYFTGDYGNTWILKSCPAPYVRSIEVKDSAIFITGDYDGVYKSVDNGASWSSIDSGIVNPAQVWSLTQNDSLLILGTSGTFAGDTAAIYVSSDHGALWTKVLSLGIYDVFYSFAVTGNEVYAGVLPSGVFYSDDKGMTWTLHNGVIAAKQIALADTHLLCGTTGGSGGIYLSDDKGISWVNVLPLYYGNAFETSGIYTFAGTSNGFYYSVDDGYTWINDNNGLPPQTHIYSICVADSFVFIGATSGIYRRNINEFTVAVPEIPGSSAYFDIIPNPSTGNFVISAPTLIKSGTVTIYNGLGSVMVKDMMKQTSTMELNLNEIFSGIYFVKLSDGNHQYFKKIIIE